MPTDDDQLRTAIEEAVTERDAEFLSLADLDDETVDKLAHAEEEPDPLTDGLDCSDRLPDDPTVT